VIKSDNKEPSKSTSWKSLETVMSHLKKEKKIECPSKHKHAKLKNKHTKTLLEIFNPEDTFPFKDSSIGFGLKNKLKKDMHVPITAIHQHRHDKCRQNATHYCS